MCIPQAQYWIRICRKQFLSSYFRHDDDRIVKEETRKKSKMKLSPHQFRFKIAQALTMLFQC